MLLLAPACDAALGDAHSTVRPTGDAARSVKTSQLVALETAPRVARVSIGRHHVCALSEAGQVFCWGRNDARQVGDGTQQHRSLPTLVAGLGPASQVAAGDDGSCAITRSGELHCWGTVARSKLQRPTRVDGLSDVREVAIGSSHACAVVGAGSVRCWGANAYGQLGNGTTLELDPRRVAIVADLHDARAVVVGSSTSCALRKGGDVVCWGAERSNKASMRTTPGPIAGLPRLSSIGVSNQDRVWGLSTEGSVYSWGNLPKPPNEAIKVEGWPYLEQLVTGVQHRCSITADRQSVQCAGNSLTGATGLDPASGTTGLDNLLKRVPPPPPHDVPGLSGVSSKAVLAAGGQMTCVLDGGELACMGSNDFGQLGIGEIAVRGEPFEVPNLEGVQRVLPFSAATCALKEDGRVACWGQGSSAREPGPAGLERRRDPSIPRDVEGLSGVTGLVLGPRTSEACATKANGDLWCFQAGVYAYPGATDDKARAFEPHRVLGLKNVVSTERIIDRTAPLFSSAYAVLADGAVVAWKVQHRSEREHNGELVADVVRKSIAGLTNVAQMVVSANRACALYKDGTVGCFTVHPPFGTWDRSDVDPLASKPEIVRIEGVEGAVELAVADRAAAWPHPSTSFFARTRTGSVLRWDGGVATDKGPVPRTAAAIVPSLAGATALSHGGFMCIARSAGINCERDFHAPMAASSVDLPFHLDTGSVRSIEHNENMCAVKENKRVACWGNNRSGALGAPDRDYSAAPLKVELPRPAG